MRMTRERGTEKKIMFDESRKFSVNRGWKLIEAYRRGFASEI